MGLLSQAKKESKNLFNNIETLKKLKSTENSYEKFDKIKDFFYQLKGFKNFSAFEDLTLYNKKLDSSDILLKNIPLQLTFNHEKLMSNDEIILSPLPLKKIKNIVYPIKFNNDAEIFYHKNLLHLDDNDKHIAQYSSQEHTLLITDDEKLTSNNSKIISLNNSSISIDPLNPLIGDVFSIKYFFGEKIYSWVNEILCFIKSNEKIVDIKHLENIFYLPNLIQNLSTQPETFVETIKYLKKLFRNETISYENITSDILINHSTNCYNGLVFAEILKKYDCFQTNGNCDFYIENEALSVLLSNKNDFDKIASAILTHNIFQCSALINFSYSAIIWRCSLEFLFKIQSYKIKNMIFCPYIKEIGDRQYHIIVDTLFLNSHTYLINMNVDLDIDKLPYSYIDKVCEISNFPIEFRRIKNFTDLKLNKFLHIYSSYTSDRIKFSILDIF